MSQCCVLDVSVILAGKSRSLRPRVVAAAFCVPIAALAVPAAPARADLFGLFAYPAYERARPSTHHLRKHRKPRHKDVKIDKQKIPRGPVQVVVSIGRQRAILYSDGVRIAEGAISTGVPRHPTPMGVFSVIAKARYHRSNIYSGAPMPYMQRITWSGIALHEGPLPGFPASHGCIRLTGAFAAQLWGISKVGARVIVTRDEVAPVPIESDRLFVPKTPDEKPPEDAAAPMPVLMAARAAVAGTAVADNAAAPATAESPAPPVPVTDTPAQNPQPAAKEAPKPKRPLEVFVSRKAAKVYVKQGFAPLFEAPVTVAEPDKPWGTHVFTVMDIKDGKASWTVTSIPSGYAHRPARHHGKRSAREIKDIARQEQLAGAPTAAEALERFELPKDAIERISERLIPGSSLIVSDNGLSDETGPDTGFIVSTR